MVDVPRPARDHHLEHRAVPSPSVAGGDVGLRPVLEGLAYADPPFGLQRRYEDWQSLQPRGGSHCLRLGAYHARDLEHFGYPASRLSWASSLAPSARGAGAPRAHRRNSSESTAAAAPASSSFPLSSALRNATASAAKGSAEERRHLVGPHGAALVRQRAHAVRRQLAAVPALDRHEIPLRLHVQSHDPGHPFPERLAHGGRSLLARGSASRPPGRRCPTSCTSPATASSASSGWSRWSIRAVWSAWSSCDTSDPGPSGYPVPLASRSISSSALRPTTSVTGSRVSPLCHSSRRRIRLPPHALGPTAAQPVDGEDGLAREGPRRRRGIADLAPPGRPAHARPPRPPASTTSATPGGRSRSSVCARR